MKREEWPHNKMNLLVWVLKTVLNMPRFLSSYCGFRSLFSDQENKDFDLIVINKLESSIYYDDLLK